MKQSTNNLNEAIERMTTGYKINHAKDNAANYSISTNMSTKISAYDVAADNVAMGMDMLTTASENMTQMENLGKRLHALNTQARNGTYGKQSLNAIQAEANSIIDEINRLYSTAKYNGISLFNQKEYNLPEGMPQADPVTGFIENPYDYTEEQIAEMISISKVDSFESGKTYSISSAKELKRFADIVNDGNTGQGSTFVLTADIDLSEYSSGEGWTPIGDYATDTNNQFRGTFNGNGHIISNLTVSRPTADYQGLFGNCGSGFKIFNLGVESVNIRGRDYVGGITGYASTGGSRLINCFAKGYVTGSINVGGLVGSSSTSGLFQCYSEANVKGNNHVGGLLGSSFYGIEDCYATGNVDGNIYVGGLIGTKSFAHDGRYTTLNCYSRCNVIGNDAVGGLIGILGNAPSSMVTSNSLENCISYSTVSGNSRVGSFVGILSNKNGGVMNDYAIVNCKSLSNNLPMISGACDNNNVEYDYDLSTMLVGIEETQLKNTSTNLQVGTKSDENSQIDFNTNFEYALGRIKRDGIQSEIALNAITDYLNTMSDKQTQLGAVQNRLESAMDEIITQHDNLISARSTLRDADMAELSSAYIQQQILQEASATLMSTANQSPAIALQLI